MKKYVVNLILALLGLSPSSKRGATKPAQESKRDSFDELISDFNQQVEFQPGFVVVQFELLPKNWINLCNREQRLKLAQILVRAKWLLELHIPAPDSACKVYTAGAFDIPGMVSALKPLALKELEEQKATCAQVGGHIIQHKSAGGR